jgi:hypothetical protein
MLLIVVLAQEERARASDHFYLCLGHAAPVTWNPEARMQVWLVVPERPGGALRLAEVVAEESHCQSLRMLISDPLLTTAGHRGTDYPSVTPT